MSDDCCQNKSKDLENIQKQHSNVLWIVLFINLIMFVIELVSGFKAKSLALGGGFARYAWRCFGIWK